MIDLIRERNANPISGRYAVFMRQPGQDIGAAKAMSGVKPDLAKASLPKGLGAGKTAAIVAAVGLVGAGIYMLAKKKHDAPDQWTSRIEAERAQGRASGPALGA